MTGTFKFISALFLFGTVWQNIAAEAPLFVAQIKPQHKSAAAKTYTRLAAAYERLGRADLAGYVKERYFNEAFGFLYVDEIGDNYIITTRSAVQFADKADALFYSSSGRSRLYRNCQVIYADDRLNIAVLTFEAATRPFKEGLPFLNENLTLGEEVWLPSDGFNALAEDWSGSGFVQQDGDLITSNAPFSLKAEGGPLLVKDEEGRWRAAGLNFIDFEKGQGSLAAYSASDVQEVFIRAKRSRSRAVKAVLEREAAIFAQMLAASDLQEASEKVAWQLAAANGLDIYTDELGKLSPDKQEEWQKLFLGPLPVKAFNMAIVCRAALRAAQGAAEPPAAIEAAEIKTLPVNAADESTETVFKVNGMNRTIEWIYSHGGWGVYKMGKLLESDGEEKARNLKHHGIKMAFGENFSTPNVFSSELALDVDLFKYLGASIGFEWQKLHYKAPISATTLTGLDFQTQFLDVFLSLKLQIPFTAGPIAIMPYGGLRAGAGFSLSDNAPSDDSLANDLLFKRAGATLILGWLAGLELGFGNQPHLFLGAEAGYNMDYFGDQALKSDADSSKAAHAGAYYLRGYFKFAL